MSRIFKFRFWDEEVKVMTNGFGRPQMVIRLGGRVVEGSTLPKGTLMQYTGLKDKNDVEIYEGDIILCVRMGELIPYKVYINPETQQQDIVSLDGESDYEGLYDYHFSCQVIGNIYENPELIT